MTMQEIAQRIGKEYGYTDIKAEFSRFKDFKLKWKRATTWIDFQIPDYLEGAPDAALEDLFETVYRKIRGERADYGAPMVEYLNSEGFVKANQMKFMRRKTNCYLHAKLDDVAHDLIERGLAPKGTVIMGYDGRWRPAKAYETSHLMKVVVVPMDIMDDERLLGFVAYCGVFGFNEGFTPGNRSGVPDEYINGSPDAEYALDKLKTLGRWI